MLREGRVLAIARLPRFLYQSTRPLFHSHGSHGNEPDENYIYELADRKLDIYFLLIVKIFFSFVKIFFLQIFFLYF
jgi:hypothetical protein